jgi:uncharacterized damage-inducible protein DinB
MSDLRYPVGNFQYAGPAAGEQRQKWIADIAETPARLRTAIQGLSAEQLDTPYRPEGWTVRQVVHHVPDSHMNAYVRLRLALTETAPTIKPYQEALWAELPDARTGPVDISLQLLEAMHCRWVALLRSLKEQDWQRIYRHPEMGDVTMEKMLALYAWHGRHHVAHITELRKQKGW